MKKSFIPLCLAVAAVQISAATIKIKPAVDKIWNIGETVPFTSRVSDQDGNLLTSGSYTLTVTNSGGDQIGWKAGCRPGSIKINTIWKEKREQLENSLPYFDCTNFALRIKTPVLIAVGFADMTCAPSTIYAAYNNLQGPKRIYHMLYSGHINSKEFTKEARAFLKAEFSR